MVEMAEKVLRSNNASNVKIINKHSSELLLPKDIPSRVSLIVTETLDSGLLGEGILYTLSHAWSNLLLPPTCPLNRQINQSGKFAFVIPFGAKIYVTGIECDSISKRSHLNQTENFFNFDGSYVVHDCGNYDTQDLNLVGHKYLTNTEELLVVNFNDPNFIEEMLSGKLDKELKLSCKESGRLDCFAVWFDLLVDENIVLNTGPESTTNHAWEQAIFLLPKSQLVTKNQDLVIEALFLNSHLRVKCRSLWEESLELSKDVITVLNNTKLVQALLQTKNKLLNAFNHSVNIIDWFPFPIFGLNFIMSRSKDFKDKLICFVSSEKDQQIVNLIAHKYGLEDQVTVEIENNVEDYLLKKEKYDLVILNFVECTGEIKENCVSQLGRIR